MCYGKELFYMRKLRLSIAEQDINPVQFEFMVIFKLYWVLYSFPLYSYFCRQGIYLVVLRILCITRDQTWGFCWQSLHLSPPQPQVHVLSS